LGRTGRPEGLAVRDRTDATCACLEFCNPVSVSGLRRGNKLPGYERRDNANSSGSRMVLTWTIFMRSRMMVNVYWQEVLLLLNDVSDTMCAFYAPHIFADLSEKVK
jgi:hypothetical protein